MTEEFLQFVWEQRLFDSSGLFTLSGEKVVIIETGMRNDNAGPDFFNARIRLGETLWAGNVRFTFIHLTGTNTTTSTTGLTTHYSSRGTETG